MPSLMSQKTDVALSFCSASGRCEFSGSHAVQRASGPTAPHHFFGTPLMLIGMFTTPYGHATLQDPSYQANGSRRPSRRSTPSANGRSVSSIAGDAAINATAASNVAIRTIPKFYKNQLYAGVQSGLLADA